MKRLIFFAASIFLIMAMQGCAVQKQLVPTGGSRADGTVNLSFQYNSFEAPQIDPQQGVNAARQTCIAWGYTDATQFGGSFKRCVNFLQGSCNAWQVTYKYQCTTNTTPAQAEGPMLGQGAGGGIVAPEAVNIDSALDKLVGQPSVEQQNAAPSGYIPSINARVTKLKFFESGPEKPAFGQRTYSNSFGKSWARYINWELNLSFPAKSVSADFDIDAIWYAPNGNVFAKKTSHVHVKDGWKNLAQSSGRGWKEPGHFTPGNYRVDIFVSGEKVASDSFEINQD